MVATVQVSKQNKHLSSQSGLWISQQVGDEKNKLKSFRKRESQGGEKTCMWRAGLNWGEGWGFSKKIHVCWQLQNIQDFSRCERCQNEWQQRVLGKQVWVTVKETKECGKGMRKAWSVLSNTWNNNSEVLRAILLINYGTNTYSSRARHPLHTSCTLQCLIQKYHSSR